MRYLHTLTLLLLPALSLAHTSQLISHSFWGGFTHPLLGMDHLLAMFAIGLWSSQLEQSNRLILNVSFLIALISGALLGIVHISIPTVEFGILLSVLLLGLFITFKINLPFSIMIGLTIIFAVFHGHAHGSELTVATGSYWFIAGFSLASLCLQLSGMLFSRLLQNKDKAKRNTGMLITLGGLISTFI